MKQHLGLVCLTTTDEVRYRALTRTRFLAMPFEDRIVALRNLYGENAAILGRAVEFCDRHDIRLYRMTSSLFPFGEDEPGSMLLDELAPRLRAIGRRADALGIRLVMHPDQFVVLSSDTPQVIVNSIAILRHHARVMDLLRRPRSPWAALTIHGGKGKRADRLVETVGALPEEIRSRLVLENDESAYGAGEILDVCRRAGVPMVFDAHHHLVHDELPGYDHPSVRAMTLAARRTWPTASWQLVHISNGRERLHDARHADFITTMPPAFHDVAWIEVEAKAKEEAIQALRAAGRGISSRRER